MQEVGISQEGKLLFFLPQNLILSEFLFDVPKG